MIFMIFKNFIELNSIVANGFFVNDIISLLKKEDMKIEKKDQQILNDAIKFLRLIQDGFKFLSEEIPVEDLEDSLNAFKIAFEALKNRKPSFKLNELSKILNDCKNELEKLLLEKGKISNQEVSESIKLYDSIRILLLEKAKALSNNDNSPLEI